MGRRKRERREVAVPPQLGAPEGGGQLAGSWPQRNGRKSAPERAQRNGIGSKGSAGEQSLEAAADYHLFQGTTVFVHARGAGSSVAEHKELIGHDVLGQVELLAGGGGLVGAHDARREA